MKRPWSLEAARRY